MSKKAILILGIIAICTGLLVLRFTGQQQAVCVEYTNSFTENFDTDQYKDPSSSVANWPTGPIKLNRLGGNFEVSQPTGMGARMYVVGAGDFNGDGSPDLVGLDYNTYELKMVWNNFNDANADEIDDDGIVFQVDNSRIFDTGLTVGPASITVGDYNGDGLLDFFFYKNTNDSFTYNNFVACMYLNQGTKDNPVFYPRTDSRNLNFTARFMAAGIYCNWAANHLCTVDIDKDGDQDVLVASQDRIFLVRNPGQFRWSDLGEWDVSELNYDQRTGYIAPTPGGYPDRGTSAVAAGDFDLDGDIDVVAGSVNAWNYLVYYQNLGGKFSRSEILIPEPTATGTVALAVADFTMDSQPDIFGATDRFNAGNQAHMWIFRHGGYRDVTVTDPDTGEPITYQEVIWNFQCLNDCLPIIPPTYDVDICTMLDYDNDGDLDLVVADANHSGDYYLIINKSADVYVLRGEAISKNLVENILDPRQYAITKARIIRLNQGVLGSSDGLSIQFFLSNDGGLHWEQYKTFSGSDIRPWSDSDWYTFKNFGANLKWKAILTATEDPMADYTGASFDTPLIRDLTIEFTYVGRQEYSRSSVATSVIDRSGQNRKMIIAASFIYPGWEGHLRAYDVTAMTAIQNAYSNLRTVSRSDLGSETGRWLAEGVELLWDAGELLDERDPRTRTIYTAINTNTSLPPVGTLQRIEFNLANVNLMKPIMRDYQNNEEALILFVRGHGRYWRLGDINHSTPAVVGPPSEDPRLMGDGYAEFKNAYQNRRKVVYVGANDGMLHCFDVTTGEELWAFIPYNQLSRLKEMWPVDQATGIRYFSRKAYVDGSPSVSDVYINGQWRTVLICGQGEGYGQSPDGYSNGTTQNYHYYYFALDVTEPENPIPLWEFAGERVKRQGSNYNMTNGQTWSVPYIAKVTDNGNPIWVCFVGSGYAHQADTAYQAYIGNTFAAIKIENCSLLYSNRITDIDSSKSNNSGNPFANIYVSFPGSPNGVDLDLDGDVDYVYIGDLDGRLWRLDVTSGKSSGWSMRSIFKDRCCYPIITKPAVWKGFSTTSQSYPRIYFGTGGHEQAPSDRYYSFVALIDEGGNTATLEWYMGNANETGLDNSKRVGELTAGEKVWADPVVANYIVYFSTLKGSIEAADPCQSLGGEAGKLYARFIQAVLGIPTGGSALKNAQGQSIDYLALASKARTAVTVGERQRAGGTYKQDVYIQEYDSTIEKLEQPVGAMLKIKSWREIYRIVR
ncbi:MAG: PQQ-binding-like beta-propeller repeat protein [Candidatus Aminicenantes bacterium]|nr:PQQ-binding-like beta-propeller repeat protein [Candidatus Aminicenantes bacterium]